MHIPCHDTRLYYDSTKTHKKDKWIPFSLRKKKAYISPFSVSRLLLYTIYGNMQLLLLKCNARNSPAGTLCKMYFLKKQHLKFDKKPLGLRLP